MEYSGSSRIQNACLKWTFVEACVAVLDEGEGNQLAVGDDAAGNLRTLCEGDPGL